MIIHNVMDGSLSIKLTTQQLEELLYQKDTIVPLEVEVDGQITEITIEKAKEWNEYETNA